MQIRSLGYRTDLIFPRFDGEIIDRDTYLVIRTLSNPTFYWGNFLLFADPPGAGDFERWGVRFAQEIGTPPITSHMTFGWDTTTGETGRIEPFLNAGFKLAELVVLTAPQVVLPPHPNPEIMVRPLETDEDWNDAIRNQVLCRAQEHDLKGYLTFKERQMARYRRMAEAGLGEWFGTFLGDALVGDFGIFVDRSASPPLARFQSVGVHPEFRRQGICQTMIHAGARYALETMEIEILVMVAEEREPAARIYESVGFAQTEKQVALEKWEKH